MFYPLEAFFLLEAFVILHRDGVCSLLICRGLSLMLSYTGMVYVLSCRGFLDVIVHRDGVCSIL